MQIASLGFIRLAPIRISISRNAVRYQAQRSVGLSLAVLGLFWTGCLLLALMPGPGKYKDFALMAYMAAFIVSAMSMWPWLLFNERLKRLDIPLQIIALLSALLVLALISFAACQIAGDKCPGQPFAGSLLVPGLIGVAVFSISVIKKDHIVRNFLGGSGNAPPLEHIVSRRHGPARNRWIAWAIFSALAGSIPLLFLSYNQVEMEDVFGAELEVLMRLLLLSAVMVFLYYGTRFAWVFLRPDAKFLLEPGTPPLCLFLRSFIDEHSSVRNFLTRVKLERVFYHMFGARGTFVAIGNPSERIPNTEALRTYAKAGDWQSIFYRFLECSHTVIALAGTSHWLKWELETVSNKSKLARLVIVFPDHARLGKRLALEFVQDALPICRTLTIDETDLGQLMCITFQHEGQVIAIFSEKKSSAAYNLAIEIGLASARNADNLSSKNFG